MEVSSVRNDSRVENVAMVASVVRLVSLVVGWMEGMGQRRLHKEVSVFLRRRRHRAPRYVQLKLSIVYASAGMVFWFVGGISLSVCRLG